jgi:hypothetical protein
MGSWLLSFGMQLLQTAHENGWPFLIDLILTFILAYPLFDHLMYGWTRKAAEIRNSLSASAKQTYLEVYQQKSATIESAPTDFDLLYRAWYGRGRYVVPIISVLVVAALENWVLANALLKLVASNGKLDSVPAAIAGAYTFVTWDFFARVQRRNLLIGDILRGGLRLAIAIPLGLALSTLSDGVAPFLAFAVGVFPLDTISTILRQLANKKLNLELGAAEAQSQVGKLSDIDSTIADRIEDADITTIAQLAWCDPIQLTMRTNLYFAFITDIVSQALAWVYLETKLNLLRPFGLRGAFEIRIFLGDDLASADAREKAQAEAVLAAAAIAVSMSVDSLRYSFEQIAYDPSTKFLSEAS